MAHYNAASFSERDSSTDIVINRQTELRHLPLYHKHKITALLEESESWKQLMSIIPKNLNATVYSSSDANIDWNDECKYKIEHIDQISNPIQGESRRCAEIFFDEWSTSGRKEHRPNLGVLLHLLVKAELFGAADYVAKELLKEPPPPRPNDGPGARINLDFPSAIFNEIDSFVNSSGFNPNTEEINLNAMVSDSTMKNNQDFFIKYRQSEKIFDEFREVPPIPAPRTNRKSDRLQKQNSTTNTNKSYPQTATKTLNGSVSNETTVEDQQVIDNRTTRSNNLPYDNGTMEETESNQPDLPDVSLLNSILPALSVFNQTEDENEQDRT